MVQMDGWGRGFQNLMLHLIYSKKLDAVTSWIGLVMTSLFG